MRPARVRPDQHVLAVAQIVLDIGEAAPLHPSPIVRDSDHSTPLVLPSPVEDDGDLLALPKY
jgi:hypothetical protein